MAGERSDLGKIFITPGGDYDATVTYETLTMVKYNNSLYLTLRTVTGVTPSDDRVNYLLMAQGFTATRLESITATDVQGLVTEPGDEMPAQTLINAIADRVANQLVTNSALTDILGDYILKSAIANNLSITEEGKVLDARQGKALNDAYTTLNSAMRTGYSGNITSSVTGVTPGVSTIVRVGKQINFCLFFASTSFNSTSGNEITVGNVPADFRPLANRYAMGYVAMNGTRIPTYFMIKTNGNVAFVGYANGTVQGLGVAGSYLYGD